MEFDGNFLRGQEVEFLAALNLVPQSIKAELCRRQQNARNQFGKWWERLHSQNFSLIQSFTVGDEPKEEENTDDKCVLSVPEALPEKVEDVYLEMSKVQSDISTQSDTQQHLIDVVTSLKTKLAGVSEQKQLATSEGNKLLTSMQSLFEWASL